MSNTLKDSPHQFISDTMLGIKDWFWGYTDTEDSSGIEPDLVNASTVGHYASIVETPEYQEIAYELRTKSVLGYRNCPILSQSDPATFKKAAAAAALIRLEEALDIHDSPSQTESTHDIELYKLTTEAFMFLEHQRLAIKWSRWCLLDNPITTAHVLAEVRRCAEVIYQHHPNARIEPTADSIKDFLTTRSSFLELKTTDFKGLNRAIQREIENVTKGLGIKFQRGPSNKEDRLSEISLDTIRTLLAKASPYR